MASPLKLEVFETPDVVDGPVTLMPEEVEDLRLNAYERGYGAGWEDGGRQAEIDDDLRRTAIAKQIEQLSFTYHEARGHVLESLRPLLEAMMNTVIPAAARSSVVPLTIEQILPLANASAASPITLRVSNGRRADFEEAIAGLMVPPLEIVETEGLADGQAEFAFDALETRIDLSHAASALSEALRRFYQIQTEESRRA